MKKLFEVLPPTMPNYVRFKKEAGLKQDGFKVDDGFDIKNLTREEAEEFAELMKQTFIKHWEARVNTHESKPLQEGLMRTNVNPYKGSGLQATPPPVPPKSI
jgi:hypothetical protein